MVTSPAKKAIDANRGKVEPFVTNQVSLHDHQPQKINGKVYNFSSSQIPNLDRHVATMTIPSQVSVPASFFASLSNYYSFKMQAGRYSCKNLTLEMDLTNTLAAAVQLVPAPLLVDYVRITTGSGSTTGAGLTMGTQISLFEWWDSHNTSIQNGVLTRDAIARYEYGTREFDSMFFQNNYAYLTCWVPRPMELIKHPCNTGFQYFENNFLNITATSTATVTVDVYAVQWSILQLNSDGQLSVDN